MHRLFPRGWGVRASLREGIQDFEKQPRGGFSLVALRKAGGARSVTEGERGRKEYEDAPPLRISHTHSPPPPMAEPPPGGSLIYPSPTDSRDGEGVPFCGGSKPPPYENDT